MDAWMKPMLCASADDVPLGDYSLEPKLDGWRFLLHNTGRGVLAYAGRNGSDYTGKLPYIEKEVASLLPKDTAIDGELVGVSWGDVQSIMGSNGVHIPTGGAPHLRLVVFDVLRCDGQDTRKVPWTGRRSILESAALDQANHLDLTPVYPATDRALQVAVATGFEGVVCKLRDSTYVNGRSASWVKIKANATAEARVTGFKPGEGDFAGLVGAIEFEMLDENDRPTGVHSRASGMTMDVRKAMSVNQAMWIGEVIEIKHYGIGSSGKPRHPQFLRKRPDKATPAPPARTPRKAPTPRPVAAGTWMRNYGAMGDAKLLDVCNQLQRGYGDAVERVRAKNGDLDLNRQRAMDEARSRGLRP